MGFDRQPSTQELRAALALLLRRSLLDRADNAPMLIINGADDDLIPQVDTLVFEGRSNTEVHLLPDTGHCALSKLGEVLDLTVRWLPTHLGLDVAAQVRRKVDAGLTVCTEALTSSPDGNTVQIQYIRPDGADLLPCI